MRKGDKVISRGAEKEGVLTGATKMCTMEGCRAMRYFVRWEDGRLTIPCAKSLAPQGDKVWRLI